MQGKKELFGKIESDEILREAIDILMKDEAILISSTDKIKGLSEENALKAFDIVAANALMTRDCSDKPDGFVGLKVLTETHIFLRKKFVDFVSVLPLESVGEWVITGWEKAIPMGCEERQQLEGFFDNLLQNGNDWVKTALRTKRVY